MPSRSSPSRCFPSLRRPPCPATQHSPSPSPWHRLRGDPRLLHSLIEYRKGIVERPLRLVQDVDGRPPEHYRTGLILSAAGELDHLVFADHNLFYPIARSELCLLGVVKRGDDVSTKHRGESLRPIEV